MPGDADAMGCSKVCPLKDLSNHRGEQGMVAAPCASTAHERTSEGTTTTASKTTKTTWRRREIKIKSTQLADILKQSMFYQY